MSEAEIKEMMDMVNRKHEETMEQIEDTYEEEARSLNLFTLCLAITIPFIGLMLVLNRLSKKIEE